MKADGIYRINHETTERKAHTHVSTIDNHTPDINANNHNKTIVEWNIIYKYFKI